MATKITELFNVGDKVSWITIKKSGRTIDIQKHSGIIDEITGTVAAIKPYGKSRRKRISLFELENNTNPFRRSQDIHKWPGSIGG